MMRIWRATDDSEELFARSFNSIRRAVVQRAGTHTDGFTFEGVYSPPEPWEWKRNGERYEYADWIIEPLELLS